MPGQNEPITNRVYQRLPRHMATVIFRDYPAQAQRFTAERLQDEGWFDGSGWAITDWFRESGDRFSNGEPAVVGTSRPWGREAWQMTSELWRRFGVDNFMLLEPSRQENYEKLAQAFADRKHLQEGSPPPVLREDELDQDTRDQLFAWMFLRAFGQAKHLCNFDFHYNRARVEEAEETIQARKTFFEALDAQRLRNDEPESLRKYLDPKGIPAWRKVLGSNKVFRGDSLMQEQTFEVQLRYVDLFSRLGGSTFKAQAAGMLLIPSLNPAGGGVCPIGLASWVPPLITKNWDNPLLGGPFDGTDEEGEPFISPVTKEQVLQRFFPALVRNPNQASAAPGSPPVPPTPPR
jgi:hypothetical protein